MGPCVLRFGPAAASQVERSQGYESKFSGKILANTSTPAWLDSDQISTLLASQVKKFKDLRKEKQRKEDGHHKHKHKKRYAKANIRQPRKAKNF